MGGALKPRIIICDTCGEEVVTTGGHTLRCKECSKIVSREKKKQRRARRAKHGSGSDPNHIQFHDTPAKIQRCLSCKKPDCNNCLKRKRKYDDE
jgi:hypothetical protein